MADGAVLGREVANLVVAQIELDVEIEEVDDSLRHEAESAMNVLVAMEHKGV